MREDNGFSVTLFYAIWPYGHKDEIKVYLLTHHMEKISTPQRPVYQGNNKNNIPLLKGNESDPGTLKMRNMKMRDMKRSVKCGT